MSEPGRRLDRLVSGLQDALGDGLVAVYVHGSLALGCFNPALSDVDVLVVTKAPLSPAQRQALGGVLPRAGRIEISFLAAPTLRPWRHPAPYDLHYSWKRSRPIGPGEDPDLAAHFTVARHAGVALVGPPATDVLPEVPWHDYQDSLRRDLDWCRENATELYGVLSPARVWATLTDRSVHSKATGAAWALKRVPAAFRPLLERALSAYHAAIREPELDPDEVRRFAGFVADELRPSRSRASGDE